DEEEYADVVEYDDEEEYDDDELNEDDEEDDEDTLPHRGNPEANVTFRVLEATLESKVQALLDMDPQQRFLYAVETDNGVLLSPMSDVVHNLPLGFTGSAMFAPGSKSPVRMPYALPNDLLNAKSYLYGDVTSGSLSLPVKNGPIWTAGSSKQSFEHEYFTFTINSLSPVEKESSYIALDFTVADKVDGQGTSGFDGILTLERDTRDAPVNQAVSRKGLGDFGGVSDVLAEAGVILPDTYRTQELIYGGSDPDGNWGAFDGQSRRGVMIFALPDNEYEAWTLTCSYLPDMNISITNTPSLHPALLSLRPPVRIDEDFQQELNNAVQAAINKYEGSRPKPSNVARISPGDAEILARHTPSPSLTLHGLQLLKSAKTDEDFLNIMRSMRWVPNTPSFDYMYSPESVLTQGWGSQQDLLMLAQALLSRLGYQPKIRPVRLTAAGIENLVRIGGTGDYYDYIGVEWHALSYTDSQGKGRVFVPVFNRDISELNGLCSLTNRIENPLIPLMGNLRVYARGRLTEETIEAAQASTMSDIGSILGGDEPSEDGAYYEEADLLTAEFPLPDIGQDTFDISLVSIGKSEDGSHDIVTAVADTRFGFLKSPELWIDTSCYDVESVSVELTARNMDNSTFVHTTLLEENQKLTDVFFTVAFAAPELSGAAAESYEAAVKREAEAAQNPTDYAAVRWLGHAAASRLIKVLGDYDKELSQTLEVTTGRTDRPFAMAVTVRSDGTNAKTSIDLMNHRNEVKSNNLEAVYAYNLMLGCFASYAEGVAMPGGMGRSYMDVWISMPDGAGFFIVDADQEMREKAVVLLTEQNYPKLLIERISSEELYNTAFLIPSAPGKLDDQERWAWLEIDVETMDVISVFDTGERAGMASYLLGLTPKNCAEVTAGALVGLTVAQFSIATYALITDDPEVIIASAEMLAYYIHEQLKYVLQQGKKPKEIMGEVDKLLDNPIGYAMDTIGDKLESDKRDEYNDLFNKATGINVKELYEEYIEEKDLTFVDGFEGALKLYFDQYK
ncbi:MAG: hypothetical protein PHG58_00310, partial [Clostridia bacterium]|nr:hypothetical protein [Clostridia bacterium]